MVTPRNTPLISTSHLSLLPRTRIVSVVQRHFSIEEMFHALIVTNAECSCSSTVLARSGLNRRKTYLCLPIWSRKNVDSLFRTIWFLRRASGFVMADNYLHFVLDKVVHSIPIPLRLSSSSSSTVSRNLKTEV